MDAACRSLATHQPVCENDDPCTEPAAVAIPPEAERQLAIVPEDIGAGV
jgi:hypothetical protein